MKITVEKVVEIALTAGIAGIVALGGSLGFSSPNKKLEQHDKDIAEVKANQAADHTDVAVLKTDVKYIRQGVDKLLGFKTDGGDQ